MIVLVIARLGKHLLGIPHMHAFDAGVDASMVTVCACEIVKTWASMVM
jgi:hypothetical protein